MLSAGPSTYRAWSTYCLPYCYYNNTCYHHYYYIIASLYSAWFPQGKEISASLLLVPLASPQLMTPVHHGEFQVLLPWRQTHSRGALGYTVPFKDHTANGLISLTISVWVDMTMKLLPSYSNWMSSSPLCLPIPTEFYEFVWREKHRSANKPSPSSHTHHPTSYEYSGSHYRVWRNILSRIVKNSNRTEISTLNKSFQQMGLKAFIILLWSGTFQIPHFQPARLGAIW